MYKDKATKNAASKAWYWKNKERAIAASTKWRKENRERYLESRRRGYKKRDEHYREKARVDGARYYRDILKPRRLAEPQKYKALDREHSQRVYKKRKELLAELRMAMGGMCLKCGYKEDPRILNFHHKDKNKIDNVTNIQSLKKIRAEAAKCILLCPNCHAIEHLT